MQPMYYIGLDVHKRKISYCVKDSSGQLHAEGSLPATRFDLDRWMLPVKFVLCPVFLKGLPSIAFGDWFLASL